MAQKQTQILYTFEVPNGTREETIRQFVRDVDGAQHPVDRIITVPAFELRAGSVTVPHDEVQGITDAVLLARLQDAHGPDVRLVAVEHRTAYVDA